MLALLAARLTRPCSAASDHTRTHPRPASAASHSPGPSLAIRGSLSSAARAVPLAAGPLLAPSALGRRLLRAVAGHKGDPPCHLRLRGPPQAALLWHQRAAPSPSLFSSLEPFTGEAPHRVLSGSGEDGPTLQTASAVLVLPQLALCPLRLLDRQAAEAALHSGCLLRLAMPFGQALPQRGLLPLLRQLPHELPSG